MNQYLVPLECSMAGPSVRWSLSLIYQRLVPLLYSMAGPSVRCNLRLRYQRLVPLDSMSNPSFSLLFL